MVAILALVAGHKLVEEGAVAPAIDFWLKKFLAPNLIIATRGEAYGIEAGPAEKKECMMMFRGLV